MVLILFPYPSGGGWREGRSKHNGGTGWIGDLNRGKENRREEGKADKTMVQRKRRARPGPEGPGAYKGDANTGPEGIYRGYIATNVGHSACTSRRGGIACQGETRETEQRRRRRRCRWNEEKG